MNTASRSRNLHASPRQRPVHHLLGRRLLPDVSTAAPPTASILDLTGRRSHALQRSSTLFLGGYLPSANGVQQGREPGVSALHHDACLVRWRIQTRSSCLTDGGSCRSSSPVSVHLIQSHGVRRSLLLIGLRGAAPTITRASPGGGLAVRSLETSCLAASGPTSKPACGVFDPRADLK